MNQSAIFNAAVKLLPEQRPHFLEAACGGDPQLQEEVAALLREHDGIGSFISRPAVAASPTDVFRPLTESPGTKIGRYKLLEQIGEGGMGVVYVAEQTEPVYRRVALKVIKPGMDTKQVIARFEAERQALALMDHPNIARVLDAGTTEAGRPYFVMELVKGIPISDYCDHNRLSPRERLELFVPVCRAIQHAHQKGVIHRDIKPSNVLVSLHDGVPVPKVIDFGVAKATDQRLTERTMFTQHGAVLGTLEYMSPEQAENSALDVDTRSDVYALGVLLYELLTGGTPLERATLREAGYAEILRRIKEEEPPRPSTRLSASRATLATLSAQRKTEPSKLAGLVRGELDWIVMKALEKDRARRYETAAGFARDVERYLKDEAVEACPPSMLYRFRKFARKNKPALVTAVVIAASLILGTMVSAWQAVRATTAEAQANANATQAEEKTHEATAQRDEAHALNDKLKKTLYSAHINLAHGAWNEGLVARVDELLNQHRPKPGETDLRGFEWHYLYRLCHSELLSIKGGRYGLALSPDGQRLASGSWELKEKGVETAVKVWDAQTGQELLSIKAYSKSVAFSPDGKRLASTSGVWDETKGGYAAGEVKVWDSRTGQELLSLKGHTSVVNTVAFSPDGKRLASGSGERASTPKSPAEMKVWDAETGQELLSFKGHTGGVMSVAYSPDGKRLASASNDKTVRVWDAETGQELLSVMSSSKSVAFSPDGKRLAGADSGAVKVWDAGTGQELLTSKGHVATYMSVAFSPDGKRLASASQEPAVTMWDAETGQELFTFKGHSGIVAGVAFSPDGARLASASVDGVKIWDVTAGPEARIFSGGTGRSFSVAFSPDGRHLASGSGNWDDAKNAFVAGEVKVLDARTGQELLTCKGHKSAVRHVAFSPNGQLLASASRDKTVKVWNAQTGQELLTCNGHTAEVVSVAFSPDGGRLVTSSSLPNTYAPWGDGAGEPGEVIVWDAKTGQELFRLKGHRRFVNSVAFSPNGKLLATLSRDNTVKVWNAQTGEEILTLKSNTKMGGSVVFSPDSKRLASSNSPIGGNTLGPAGPGEVKVWDAQTGEELLTFKGHTSDISSIAFSPDGGRVASADRWNGSVKVWDAQAGHELLTLRLREQWVHSVAFSPDGHCLATDGVDGTVRIYDATPLPEEPQAKDKAL